MRDEQPITLNHNPLLQTTAVTEGLFTWGGVVDEEQGAEGEGEVAEGENLTNEPPTEETPLAEATAVEDPLVPEEEEEEEEAVKVTKDEGIQDKEAEESVTEAATTTTAEAQAYAPSSSESCFGFYSHACLVISLFFFSDAPVQLPFIKKQMIVLIDLVYYLLAVNPCLCNISFISSLSCDISLICSITGDVSFIFSFLFSCLQYQGYRLALL